ncbi:hypothetical protein ACFYNO_14410 [Kitasatospora sp. NPDC006697]|uniref:hypothetical protein n=1 Tax=unclassified Kitasatospora TaxID=2633591 RepID=UPI0036A63FF4
MGKASRGKRNRDSHKRDGQGGFPDTSPLLYAAAYPRWSPTADTAAVREARVMQPAGDPRPMAVLVLDPPQAQSQWLPESVGPTDARVRWDFRSAEDGGYLAAVFSWAGGRDVVSVAFDPWRDDDLLDCLADGARLVVTDADNQEAIIGGEDGRGLLAVSSATELAAARNALLADWPVPSESSDSTLAHRLWEVDGPEALPAPHGSPELADDKLGWAHHCWTKPFVIKGWSAVLPRAATWLMAMVAELERLEVRGDPRVLGRNHEAISLFVTRYGGWDSSAWLMEESVAETPPKDTELRQWWLSTVPEADRTSTLRSLLSLLLGLGLIQVDPTSQWRLNPHPPAVTDPPSALKGSIDGAVVLSGLLQRSYDMGAATVTVSWSALAQYLDIGWEEARDRTAALLTAPHCIATALNEKPVDQLGPDDLVQMRIDWTEARVDGLVNTHDHLQLVHDGQPVTWLGDPLPPVGPRDKPTKHHIMGAAIELQRAEEQDSEAARRLIEFCGTPAGMARALMSYDPATLRRLAAGQPTPLDTARAEQVHGPVIWRQLSDILDADLNSATPEGGLVMTKPAPPATTPFGLPETLGSQLALALELLRPINEEFHDPAIAVERLHDATAPVFERDMRVLAIGGRWGDPQRHTEPAAPGDAIALRALTLGAVLGQEALASNADGLREKGIGLDSRSYASRTLRTVVTSLGHVTADAVPFYIPTATCAGVADSTPPQGEALDDIRLPFRTCLLALGAPLHLRPRSGLWHPWIAHTLELAPSGLPVDEAVNAAERRGQGLAINLASPPPPVPVVHAAYARGAFIDGLVLTADDDGHLADAMIWLLRIPGTDRTTLTRAALPGWRSHSTLADTAINLAAALAWATWTAPQTTPLPTSRPTTTTARQERQGLLGGVRVLSLTRASAPDDTRTLAPGADSGTGRRVSPHLRRGHWRRSRIGPRTEWDGTYRNAWIPPTVVNAALGSVNGQRVYRIPEPRG